MVLSALEESAVELICEEAHGARSKTAALIELKLAQSDSESKITLCTTFHTYMRGRVFWPGRFVLERPCYRFQLSGTHIPQCILQTAQWIETIFWHNRFQRTFLHNLRMFNPNSKYKTIIHLQMSQNVKNTNEQ